MRTAIMAIMFIVMYILQASLFPHLQIMGARPDLILGTIVAIGITAGPREGLGFGFLGGLLVDLLRGTFIGLSVPGKMLMGLAVGFIPKRIYADNFLVPFVATFAAALTDQILFLTLGHSFGLDQPVWASLRRLVAPSALYTALLAPIVLRGVYQLYREFSRRGWYREQKL